MIVTFAPASSSSRFKFVDLLRGQVVFIMIETHVVKALLRSDTKEQSFFKILPFVNGLIVLSLLFCAGFALAITFYRKWSEYVMVPPWKYLMRLFIILIVGYSHHLVRNRYWYM